MTADIDAIRQRHSVGHPNGGMYGDIRALLAEVDRLTKAADHLEAEFQTVMNRSSYACRNVALLILGVAALASIVAIFWISRR